MKKVLFVCSSLILFYFKPYYSFLIIPFFLLEYVFFLYFLLIYYQNKSKRYYSILKIDDYNKQEQSSLYTWININKVLGFMRLYSIISKKNIDMKSLILVLFVLLLDVPLKLIRLVKRLIYNKGSTLYDKLQYEYDYLYSISKDLKIEFLNHKVYINCFTLRELIIKLRIALPNLRNEQYLDLIKLLKVHSKDFNQFEMSQGELVKSYMLIIRTKEGCKIPFAHPGYVWSITLNRLGFTENKMTVHGTSNVNINVEPSQIKGGPIKDFIQKDAKNPGSIITIDPVIKKHSEFRSVSKIEIESVIMEKETNIREIVGWDLKIDNRNYINSKKGVYRDIIGSYSNNSANVDDSFIHELTRNNWSYSLAIASEKEVEEILNSFEN